MFERLYELLDAGGAYIVLKGIRYSGYHKIWEGQGSILECVALRWNVPQNYTIKLLTRSVAHLVLEVTLRKCYYANFLPSV